MTILNTNFKISTDFTVNYVFEYLFTCDLLLFYNGLEVSILKKYPPFLLSTREL
jgi:hypothetical protein